MHVRAAKFIFGSDWNTPTEEVRTKYKGKTLKKHILKVISNSSTQMLSW